MILPVQTAINTRLSRALASTWLASLTSFAVGTVALGALLAVSRPSLDEFSPASHPWWIWVGGACGVVYLTSNMVLMRHLGASIAVVIPVIGQILGGVVVDHFALVGATQHSVSPARVIGAGLVVLGAWVSSLQADALRSGVLRARPHSARQSISSADEAAHSRAPEPRRHLALALIGLGVTGGVLSAIQTAANGTLGARSGSAVFAALVSFGVGTACLLAINVATRSWRGISVTHGTSGAEGRPRAALFTGGLLGAGFVVVSAYAAPVLGTSMTVSIVLLGQLIASMLIDHLGILGANKRRISANRVLGAAVVLAGVALVRLVG